MSRKKIKISILALHLFISPWIGCFRNDEEIESIALVVPETFKGPVIIFFNQNEDLGRFEFKKGKYFFYVDSTGIFFTKKHPRKGGVSVQGFSPDLNEELYSTEMSINQYSDEIFRVIGGTYRGFKTNLYKGGDIFLNFCVFKAGTAKELKNGGWYVSDSVIEGLYQKHIK